LDHRKAGIIAKVGGQVASYYKQAYIKMNGSQNIMHEVIGRDFIKILTKFAQFKMYYYSAVSYFFMGMSSEDASRMGEAVAYFTQAQKTLVQASDIGKNTGILTKQRVSDSLLFTNDVITGKFDIAKKENEFIYHEKVPEFESLPQMEGTALVKGIGFSITDREVSGQDIFHRLVPLEAHAASSMYRYVSIATLLNLTTEHRGMLASTMVQIRK
jgi:tyrosine-protein phosphatase non-receptor type 23